MVVKIGIIKCGNIGMSPLIDLALDERADRTNIDVISIGSGAKMGPNQVVEVTTKMVEDIKPDFIIYVGPNPAAPGPAKAREILSASDIPSVIIGDAPGIKAKDKMAEEGLGYILIKCDPMIGARRQFLDPVEMAMFNADVIRVLAGTGAARVVQNAIDDIVEAIEAGNEIELPKIVVTDAKSVAAAEFSNPYAKAKAMAAFAMAEQVANIDVKGCFMTKEMEKYIPIVASAHEMIRTAAKLVDEARELEKATDSVSRKPHGADGKRLNKTKLMEKPE
ncbi:F420-dependent methylenetetrahydromethanopterin dehydrogenase [Methanococcus aeolicus]|jgi:methylenetetrahydromethanopterin dehydrogenase|uniref:F420-dependent methylenetetrahydromethanopterin dehydrogenase n=1 Tax=Methanococcus aeolicus (strain ATCC BAA-1280 / DSM 17508 / OCM 812 / Nankai-3) TaxID=419665 RepID=MTD_META3|nr:F420-dependent methylenetetrahydromethanopterin dehydrogenase [Methanococcus aeolicus]A6UWS1.1 RecName: Full=F420-dependent methylenetetrahydromethanopterin dehydrogenase; Short=MTD; AltName: Full=Coenzyme F420-dependent N5,N10-methylenetetrahydromethanopterin dehydrogenase [Methanococcus aeolicus Nankai-3]ABR56943.1 Methylenetetrahydromethanopterin dehydrogenase [Methanococcus aeolicus Nankai-3]UXM84941.1 F420-dependent methylenetetrahydromethanopterin dehydrogenase [Methanococcus aeolicus]